MVPAVTFFGPPVIEGEIVDRSYRYQVLVRLEETARLVLQGDMTPIEIEDFGFLSNLESIDEPTYRYMRDMAGWATEHAPDHPAASPRAPIDWNKRRVVF